MKENKLKLFVAIPVPAEFKKDLKEFIKLNADVANIRWIPKENWHITLFFIGFINENKLNIINEKTKEIITETNPFELHFQRFSLEGKASKKSMVWARFNTSEEFEKLSNQIQKNLIDELEEVQKFKRSIPHVTLARLRKSVKRNKINLETNPDKKILEVNQCELWQSIPTSTGMKYENLYSYNIK